MLIEQKAFNLFNLIIKFVTKWPGVIWNTVRIEWVYAKNLRINWGRSLVLIDKKS